MTTTTITATATTIKPGTEQALAVARQYEQAASHLRCVAHELEALSELPDIENASYWAWAQNQPPSSPLLLPLHFTHWTLTQEAILLEARARVLRGEK